MKLWKVKEENMKEKQDAVQMEEKEEDVIRPYKLRSLKDKDLFPLLKILRKIDKTEMKKIISAVTEGSNEKILEAGAENRQEKGDAKQDFIREVGISVALEMANAIITALEKMEDEIYAFWSELSGLSPEEIKEMEFGTLPLMIMDTFSEAKNIAFFKVLSKFLL